MKTYKNNIELDATFDEDVQRSLQAGMNAHLSKPVDIDQLIRVLGELVYEAEYSVCKFFGKMLQNTLENLGKMLQNLFAQELKNNGFNPYYYDSKKYGELDFVVQNNSGVDLIEVKSGNDYKIHNVLDNVSEVDEWSFNKKVIFCKGNVEVDGEYLYLPWYMIMFYKRKKVQEMIYDISDNLYSP